jgi:hypothetical protein
MSTLHTLTRSGSSLVHNWFRLREHPEFDSWALVVEWGEHDSFREHIAKLGYNPHDLTDYTRDEL